MSYLTEELKVESLYLLNYFMKSEQDESGSKELGFILGKITKRSDYVKASKGQYIKTSETVTKGRHLRSSATASSVDLR